LRAKNAGKNKTKTKQTAHAVRNIRLV